MEHPGGSHIALEWEVPAFRRFFVRLAEQFRVVRYNPRCSGLSECPEDITLPAFLRDLAAVAEALGPEPVGLLSNGYGSIFTNAFTAENPTRVSALASLLPVLHPERATAYFSRMVRGAGERGAQTMANWLDPRHTEPHEPLERLHRNAQPFSERDRLRASLATFELHDSLPAIRVPTLILHYEQNQFSAGPEMASRVPNAHLVVRAGDGYPPWYDDDQDGLFDLLVPFFHEHADGPVAVARPVRQAAPPNPAVSRLSPREIEVLRLLAMGQTNVEIAEQLVIAPGTVARHVTNIFNKTGCKNRADAARYASEQGLTAS